MLKDYISLEQILTPNVSLWKKDYNSVFIDGNSECVKLFGLNKISDLKGLNDYEIPCKLAEYADIFRLQDSHVLSSSNPIKTIAMHFCANNEPKILLTSKSPLYSKENVIIGTFACSIDLTSSIKNIYHLFRNLNITNKAKNFPHSSYIVDKHFPSKNLSSRQSECLFFLLRGKTIKQIAQILSLSPRTVEVYIDQLKAKFICHSKSELISKAIDQGLFYIFPESLFRYQFLIMLSD